MQAFDLHGNQGDGTGKVTVPDDNAWYFGSNNFTIDLWSLFDSTAKRKHMVTHYETDSAGDRYSFFYSEVTHRLTFYIQNTGVGYVNLEYPWLPQTGRWYHLAATWR